MENQKLKPRLLNSWSCDLTVTKWYFIQIGVVVVGQCQEIANFFLRQMVSKTESLTRRLQYSQSKLSLYLQHCAEACNEFARPISASLCERATQLLLKKCHSGGEPLANTEFNLTSSRFKPQSQKSTRYRSTNWPVTIGTSNNAQYWVTLVTIFQV